jgi:hypothetical protein
MAMPRKSVSTKHPEGETGLEQRRWLRNPAIIGPIIAALIGGIFAISVAFIQRPVPTPKLSEPTKY